MNFKMIVAALLAAGSMNVQAAPQNVLTLNITGGDFAMGAPGVGACGAGGPFGNFQCLTGTMIDTADGLFEGPTLTAFGFFNAPVTTFTAATATGATNSTSGNPIMGSADAGLGTITMDMGSFYAQWSGTNFLQAPNTVGGPLNPLVTGTFVSTGANTGTFDLAWSSFISTQPFANQTGYWHLTGVATLAPVPEPETYAMMLAGLGLIGFIGMRRKSKQA